MKSWIADSWDAPYHLQRAHASTSHLAGYFATLDSSGESAVSFQAGGGQYGYGYGGVFGAPRVCLEVLEQEHEDEFVRSNVRHGPYLHCYNLPLPGGTVITCRDVNFGVQVLLFSLPRGAKRKLALHLQQNKGALPQDTYGLGPVEFRGIAHFTWVGPSEGLFEVARRVQRRLPDWFRLADCRPAVVPNTNMAHYLSEEEALLGPGGGVAVADGDLDRFTGTPFYRRMQHARQHENTPIIGFEVDVAPRSQRKAKRQRRAETGIRINC